MAKAGSRDLLSALSILNRAAPGSTRRLVAIAALTAAGGFLEAAALVLTAQSALAIAQDAGEVDLPAGRTVSVFMGAALALALLLMKFGVQCAAAWRMSNSSSHCAEQVRHRLLSAYFGARWEIQAVEPPSTIQSLASGSADRTANLLLGLAALSTAAASFTAVVLTAVAVSPIAAAGAVAGALGLLAVLRPMTRYVRGRSREVSIASLNFGSTVTSYVSLAKEIQVHGRTRQVIERLSGAAKELVRPSQRAAFALQVGPAAYQSLALGFVIGAVAVVGAIGTSDPSQLGAVMLLLLRSLSYGQQIQSSLQQISVSVPYTTQLLERVDHYRAQPMEFADQTIRDGSVVLEHVRFGYSEDSPLINDLSLSIHSGEMFGIAGPSGSGKSTLAQLILGLRTPQGGSVVLGGQDVRTISPDSRAYDVGYVAQDTRLLPGTIGDNIQFLRDLPLAFVERAAADANIGADQLQRQGLNTAVDDRSEAAFSGGQRQRMGLARALAAGPKILVLDEPTSALDVPTEQLIHDTLGRLKGDVTVIIIAHRMSTLSLCDRIAVLRDGQLEAVGGHDELKEASPFYRSASGGEPAPTGTAST